MGVETGQMVLQTCTAQLKGPDSTSCYVPLVRTSHEATPEYQGGCFPAQSYTVGGHFGGPANHVCLGVETVPGSLQRARQSKQRREAARWGITLRTLDVTLRDMDALGGLCARK